MREVFEASGTDDLAQITRKADATGFTIPNRDLVIAIKRDIEDPVEEDAVVWRGQDQRGNTMLVLELPVIGRSDRGSGPKQSDEEAPFRRWSEQTFVSAPIQEGCYPDLADVHGLLVSGPDTFEMVWKFEVIAPAVTGRVRLEILQPVPAATLKRLEQVISESVAFRFL